MANKPHLAISTEPIQPRHGQGVRVVCGEILLNATILTVWFLEPGHECGMEVFDKELRGLCTKCRKWLANFQYPEQPPEYLYVFQRGNGKEELESA